MSLFEDASALPNGLVYQPRFIDAAEEARLLEGIRALDLREAQYKEFTAKRRVASFGASYDFTEGELTPAPQVAPFLLPLRAKAAAWAGVDEERLAYALVAEYRPGTQLGWHRDVPQFEMVIGVSLGTACRMRLARLELLAPEVRGALRLVGGYPVLDRSFQSSVPGLHFVGASAAWSFGPLMRFVAGTGFAARAVAKGITARP